MGSPLEGFEISRLALHECAVPTRTIQGAGGAAFVFLYGLWAGFGCAAPSQEDPDGGGAPRHRLDLEVTFAVVFSGAYLVLLSTQLLDGLRETGRINPQGATFPRRHGVDLHLLREEPEQAMEAQTGIAG